MDPTENRAQLDELAAEFPNLVPVGQPAEQDAAATSASRRRSCPARTPSAPPRPPRSAPRCSTPTGEITAAAPVATHPVHRLPRGSRSARPSTAIPSGSTDFILTLKDPSRRHRCTTVDTGTSPEFLTPTFATAGTYTFEVSGYQGDLGDFTFKLQPVTGTAATAQAGAVVLTAKDWGHLGGDQVTAEFRTGRRRTRR